MELATIITKMQCKQGCLKKYPCFLLSDRIDLWYNSFSVAETLEVATQLTFCDMQNILLKNKLTIHSQI